MEVMFKGTGLTALYLYQDQQAALKNKMSKFYEADLHKAYAWAQGQYDKIVTIASRSFQMGRKLQAWANTAPPPGFNIAPSEYPSITSGLPQEAAEDGDDSLLSGASLAFYLSGDDISLLGYKASLTGGDIYPPGGATLGDSTATGHTSASKVK